MCTEWDKEEFESLADTLWYQQAHFPQHLSEAQFCVFCLGVARGLHCRKRALHLLVQDPPAMARGLRG